MATILVFVVCFVVVMALASRIPGVEHFVKPTLDLAFTLLKVAGATLYSWAVVATKMVIYAHLDLLKHLVLSAEKLDPTVNMRD